MTQGFQYRPTQRRSCPALLAMAATLCWVIPAPGWSPCSDGMDQIAQETSAQDALLGRDNDAMQKFTFPGPAGRAHATEWVSFGSPGFPNLFLKSSNRQPCRGARC